MDIFLKERFDLSRTISGTQKLHSFSPLSSDIVRTKAFSFSESSKTEKVSIGRNQLSSEEMIGYVTCVYEEQWWLGYVLKTHPECEEVTINFLHPHGPSRSFKFPSRPDVLTISYSDVLTRVNPSTATGRMYKLTQRESRAASCELQKFFELNF